MPDLSDIESAAISECLTVLGAFAVDGGEFPLPEGTRSLLLLGPREPGFWVFFTASPEYGDGNPDPLDRWSRRTLDGLARHFGGSALLPSGGPPYAPFFRWALRSGCLHASPIGLLVHPRNGLMASLRGALALPFDVPPPPAEPAPCATCADQPCRTACPVDAFKADGYAVAVCHNHLDTSAGSDCMEQGCAARRACPASRTSGRLPKQSAFHMRAFHRGRCDT